MECATAEREPQEGEEEEILYSERGRHQIVPNIPEKRNDVLTFSLFVQVTRNIRTQKELSNKLSPVVTDRWKACETRPICNGWQIGFAAPTMSSIMAGGLEILRDAYS